MKYSITVNQLAIVQSGFDLDLVDGAIFDMLSAFTNSISCKKKTSGDAIYFNVPYQKVIEELPICGLKTPDSVYRRFKKLEQNGLIQFHEENKKNKQVWFAWGHNYDVLVFKKVTGPKSDVATQNELTSDLNPVQTGSKSGLRPDQNPTHNNTIPITSPNVEGENAPAPGVEQSNLNTTFSKAPPVPPPPPAPRWQDVPNSNTPREFENYLTRFYDNYPDQLEAIRERTQFQNNPTGVPAAIADFCAWAVGEGWNRRTLQQINARLGRWLRDQKRFDSMPGKPGAPAHAENNPYARHKIIS